MQADVYAVGVCLYEALTARRAFDTAARSGDAIRAHVAMFKLETHYLDPGETIDARLRAVVRQLTDRDPRSRWDGGLTLYRALEELGGLAHQAGSIPHVDPRGSDASDMGDLRSGSAGGACHVSVLALPTGMSRSGSTVAVRDSGPTEQRAVDSANMATDDDGYRSVERTRRVSNAPHTGRDGRRVSDDPDDREVSRREDRWWWDGRVAARPRIADSQARYLM
jgi:hypothetical protein